MSHIDGFEPWVVLLAGGIGSRFWPASTPGRPKQFLPLASSQSLIRDTLDRARTLAEPDHVLIVAGSHLQGLIEEHVPELSSARILVEPEARGTAPALAWAAREIRARSDDPDRAVMVAMPADHVIRPPERFVETMQRAMLAAGRLGKLVTLGVRPGRPETAYGYIEVGENIGDGAFEVERFVEKPDLETAREYVRGGRFLWNSGIFIWRPDVLLTELERNTPEVADALTHLEAGDVEGYFAAVPANLTIDYGLMERTSNIAVVEAAFDWDDVGAWGAILRLRDADESGNVIVGQGAAEDSSGSIIWAEDGPVVIWGIDDLIVARASGITFVAPIDRTPDLKELIQRLPERLKDGPG